MYLTAEIKKDIFKKHGKSEFDTGKSECQVALFTHRINHLTEHLKLNHKDRVTERALVTLVGKRRRLLDYLRHTEIERYRSVIKELNLRK
jgi:small subunit ribosomal protein S15